MPARSTRISTSPSPGSGVGRSATCSTSGPPNSSIWIARMGAAAYPSGAHLEAALERPRLALAVALGRAQPHHGLGPVLASGLEALGGERLLEGRLLVLFLLLVHREDHEDDLHALLRRQLELL